VLRFLLILVLAADVWRHAAPTRIAKGPCACRTLCSWMQRAAGLSRRGECQRSVRDGLSHCPAALEHERRPPGRIGERLDRRPQMITFCRCSCGLGGKPRRACRDPGGAGRSRLGASVARDGAVLASMRRTFQRQRGRYFRCLRQPSARNIPGFTSSGRRSEDWQFWLDGGVASTGEGVLGMRQFVDAIRSTGATQVIAVQAYADSYRVPLLAGEWGAGVGQRYARLPGGAARS
jgi:hypothetical protein